MKTEDTGSFGCEESKMNPEKENINVSLAQEKKV